MKKLGGRGDDFVGSAKVKVITHFYIRPFKYELLVS